MDSSATQPRPKSTEIFVHVFLHLYWPTSLRVYTNIPWNVNKVSFITPLFSMSFGKVPSTFSLHFSQLKKKNGKIKFLIKSHSLQMLNILFNILHAIFTFFQSFLSSPGV